MTYGNTISDEGKKKRVSARKQGCEVISQAWHFFAWHQILG